MGIGSFYKIQLWHHACVNKLRNRIMNVFIIDDDIEEVEVMVEAIGDISASINVQICTDPEEAVTKLEQVLRPPDFILLDNIMPKLNAVEVIEKIRLMPSLVNCKIIVLSSDISPSDAASMERLGIAVFRKGQSFISIVNSLRTILFPETGPATGDIPLS